MTYAELAFVRPTCGLEAQEEVVYIYQYEGYSEAEIDVILSIQPRKWYA